MIRLVGVDGREEEGKRKEAKTDPIAEIATVLLNDNVIFDLILRDEVILGVASILECTPIPSPSPSLLPR